MAKPDNTLKRKEREEKEDAEDGLKFVIDGAKLKCDLCIVPEGDLKVNYDTPSTQDKRTATVVEKDKKSVIFKGNCKKSPQSASPCASVMKLADWKDVGTVYFQDEFPLLLKSTIKCEYGGVDVKITDSAQRNVIEKIDTTGAPVPPMEKLLQDKTPEYVVLFKRLPSYKGEFGWDYMRDDYLTGTCNEGLEDLKKVYNPFEIQTKNVTTSVSYGTYYTPWLSMFVNHNVVVGTDIELMIDAPVDFISETVDFAKEEMTFVPSTPNLRVVPDKMPISDAINGGRIKIFCDAALNTDAIIDIKSSKGDIVGKMNVLKNNEVDKLTINVYVIKAFMSDNSLYSENIIDTELAKIGGLSRLESYLNKQSLNQGLIQVKLIDTRKGEKLKIDLSTNTFNNVNQGLNPKDGKPHKDYEMLKGVVVNPSLTNFQVDSGKSVNLFNLQSNKLYGFEKEKCILLYLCPLKTKDAGGSSYMIPLNNKHCIIFGTNLIDLTSYAHEIGHTLGLDHTFLSKDSSCNLISLADEKTKINSDLTHYKVQIEEAKSRIDVKWNQYKSENNGYFTQNPNKIPEYKKPFDDSKAALDRALSQNLKNKNDEKYLIDKNNIRFKRAFTENIMDYWKDDANCDGTSEIVDTTSKKSFNQYQWKIIQEEAKAYYH
ncbi:DUF4280 domain-containing protein [Flavobacterium sp. LS1R47]|uniref:DUF4280 domain-containing protein n=1 Tax=Flavobacterium frigoritolerans TaxID=2987686 RepID=A0A9X3C9S9_9FLAO|nr:PAAR-like protein [Flavobacterium frigoritolerans]MCV9934255.1 DUF4280 domain-containing protein [Flavobacterium frigoritolerans]